MPERLLLDFDDLSRCQAEIERGARSGGGQCLTQLVVRHALRIRSAPLREDTRWTRREKQAALTSSTIDMDRSRSRSGPMHGWGLPCRPWRGPYRQEGQSSRNVRRQASLRRALGVRDRQEAQRRAHGDGPKDFLSHLQFAS